MAQGLDVILGTDAVTVKLNGKEYSATPLTLDDFGRFRSWVKRQRLETFMAAPGSGKLSPSQFGAVVTGVLSAGPTSDGESVSDDVLAEMGTEEGQQYLLFLSLKKRHPELKMSDLELSFSDMTNLIQVVSRISGLTSEAGEGEESNDNPTPGSPPRSDDSAPTTS